MRKIFAACPLLLAVLAVPAAYAQKPEDVSTQWMWDLRAGMFIPDIDEEFGGAAHPYADIFGNQKKLAWRSEPSWQFFRGFGTLALGADAGFFYRSGKSLLEDGSKSGDSTSFLLVPLGLKLVYRFDVLQNNYNIPLTPYAKGGLVYNLWWITDGNGDIAKWESTGKDRARGATTGYELSLGLSLLLDVFDAGIDNSYIFVEWTYNRSDGILGVGSSLQVGGRTWMFGLAFEF
jgi:hypothetical protein